MEPGSEVEVHAQQPDSLEIRRRSDGAVLPTLFNPEQVREVSRPR